MGYLAFLGRVEMHCRQTKQHRRLHLKAHRRHRLLHPWYPWVFLVRQQHDGEQIY